MTDHLVQYGQSNNSVNSGANNAADSETARHAHFPQPSSAGNYLWAGVMFAYGGGLPTVTCTDNLGHAWSLKKSQTNGVDLGLYVFERPNCEAGIEYVVFGFSHGVAYVQTCTDELWGIVQTSPADGTPTGASGSSAAWAPGSITTTQANSLVLSIAVSQSVLATSSPFSAHDGTFSLLGADLRYGFAAQYGVKATAGAINPTINSPVNGGFLAIGFALKTDITKGTPADTATRPWIRRILWGDVNTANADVTFQFPRSGNAIVLPTQIDLAATLSDSSGNGYTRHNTVFNAGAGSVQFYDCLTPAVSTQEIYTIAAPDLTLSTLSFWDIEYDGTLEFDAFTDNSGTQTTTADLPAGSITPSQGGGLTLFQTQVNRGTLHELTNVMNGRAVQDWDPSYYAVSAASENVAAQDSGVGYAKPTSGATLSPIWTNTTFDGSGVQEWTAGALSLVPAVPPSAAITGTATASITEADIVAGGKTIIATLTGDTLVPASGFAPLQYVGSAAGTGNSASFNIDLTALTGGIDTAARAGDLVIVVTGFVGTADGNPGVSTAGYTETSDLYGNDTRDANLSVNYKRMGGTPDTTVACNGSGTATNGAVGVAHVWRGGDATTPMDVAVVNGTPVTNASTTNSPSITPVTAGAVVLTLGGATSAAVNASPVAPTGYTNARTASVDPGSAFTVVVASKAWSGSGAEDPGAWGGLTTSTSESAAAVTMALRPAATTPFADARQSAINGLVSAQSELHGWNSEVVAAIPLANVVRTSDTVLTITLPAVGSYDVTAAETITWTIPGSILASGDPVIGSPTFTVAAAASGVTADSTRALPLSGSAAGAEAIAASCTKALAFASAATATIAVAAASAKAMPLSGSATASVAVQAQSAVGMAFGGSASGTATVAGSSTVAIAIGANNAATVTVQGASSAALPISGTTAGTVGSSPITAASTTALPLTGAVAGAVGIAGTSTASVALSGQAAGTVAIVGSSSRPLPISGTASGFVGTAPITADSAAALPLNGSAVGAVAVSGASTAALSIGTTSAGTSVVIASSTRALPLAGTASGVVAWPSRTADSTRALALSGTGTATSTVAGASTAVLPLSGLGTGSVAIVGSSAVTLAIGGTATGGVHSPFGTLLLARSPTTVTLAPSRTAVTVLNARARAVLAPSRTTVVIAPSRTTVTLD